MEKERLTGAVILAAKASFYNGQFKPFVKIGNISAIQRLILTLQQVGCSPIVLVTGYEARELEKHVSRMGVICVRDEAYEKDDKWEAAKLGLEYIKGQCDRLFYTPVSTPLVQMDTLNALMEAGGEMAVPLYNGRKGHPVLIGSSLIPRLLKYKGDRGLAGAMQELKEDIQPVEVQDEGILLRTDMAQEMEGLVEQYNEQMYSTMVMVKIMKEKMIFGPGTAQLLTLIEHTGSMKEACAKMNMSYSKGWNIVKRAEEQLGYPIIERRHGGVGGGYSSLTRQGNSLLERYLRMEKEIKEYAVESFKQNFPEYS